jgi:apolipoprotein N-acyltransferase
VRSLLYGATEVLKTKTLKILLLLFAPVLSGVLLVLAFPKYDLGWLAWVGLVPLLTAISGRRPVCGFFLSYVCGIIFFAWVFDWMFEVPRYALLHQIILALYLGFYFGVFGLAFGFISRRHGVTTALLSVPFIWVCLEYARSNMGFMAHPSALLGHSQYTFSQVIQIASVTGAYGVSFLVGLVNSAFAAVILYSVSKLGNLKSPFLSPITKRKVIAFVSVAAVGTALTLVYGQITLLKLPRGKAVKVSVVQGNIEQNMKWNAKYAKLIMEIYANLTRGVSTAEKPSLIVWPETATPRAINRDVGLYNQVKGIAQEAGTYLLLGSAQQQKFKDRHSKNEKAKYLNTAFLISPAVRATKRQEYSKIRLLPFGEYLPFRETIPWSYLKIPDYGAYVPGEEFTVFELPEGRFSVTICWENLFPDLIREFVKRGAQFIVNLTNEAWFGRTAGPNYFVISSVFRAVENGVYFVRCANTGISCFIDPYGRIIARVKDVNGQELFVRGVLTRKILALQSKTIYTRYGDLLVWLSIFCSGAFLVTAFFRTDRNRCPLSTQ